MVKTENLEVLVEREAKSLRLSYGLLRPVVPQEGACPLRDLPAPLFVPRVVQFFAPPEAGLRVEVEWLHGNHSPGRRMLKNPGRSDNRFLDALSSLRLTHVYVADDEVRFARLVLVRIHNGEAEVRGRFRGYRQGDRFVFETDVEAESFFMALSSLLRA